MAWAGPGLTFTKLWTHGHMTPGQLAEIPAFHSRSNTIWVVGIVGVDGPDADTGTLVTRSPSGDVSEVEVGSLPDMLTFTHDAAGADGLPLKHGG